jgi:YfiH family protein
MKQPLDTDATGEVDDLLRSVGLGHGRRKTLAGSWQNGERRARRPPAASQGTLTGPEAVKHIELLRAPDWQRFPWLRHGFSTRSGGVSTIYDQGTDLRSLNLGWTQQDEAANVAENRRRFLAAAFKSSDNPETAPRSHFPSSCLVTLRQFHSGLVRIVEADSAPGNRLQTADGRAVLRGDGAMTDLPGVLLGIQTADCVPVLLADVRRRAVAAFHAGWRGTLARIVERGVGTMRLRYGSRPQDLLAVVGPSIGPCCYAVGEELRFEFESQFAYAPQLFSEVYDSDPVREKYPLLFLTARAPGHSNIGPQIHLDLWQANRRQLLDAGIPDKRITVVGECSACAGLGTAAGRKYFSHRAENGFTGRMLSVVGVV